MIVRTVSSETSPHTKHLVLEGESVTLCRRAPKETWVWGETFDRLPTQRDGIVCGGCIRGAEARAKRERALYRKAQTRAGFAYENAKTREHLVMMQERDADGVPRRWAEFRIEYLAGKAAAEAHRGRDKSGLRCPIPRFSPMNRGRRAAWYAGADDVLTLRRAEARRAKG